MAEGFPAVSVAKEDRLEYFSALDAYAVEGSLQPFADLGQGLWTDSWNNTLGFSTRSGRWDSPHITVRP